MFEVFIITVESSECRGQISLNEMEVDVGESCYEETYSLYSQAQGHVTGRRDHYWHCEAALVIRIRSK